MKIKLFIADNQKIIRDGLKAILEKDEDFHIVGEADNVLDCTKLLEELKPDVALIDLSMNKLSNIDLTIQTLNKIRTKIIVLSMHSDEELIKNILEKNISGFILENASVKELIQAIKEVHAGKKYLSQEVMEIIFRDYINPSNKKKEQSDDHLTVREIKIIKLISEGFTTKEIAHELTLSIKSIELCRSQIMNKLKIKSIAGLVKYAIKEGIAKID